MNEDLLVNSTADELNIDESTKDILATLGVNLEVDGDVTSFEEPVKEVATEGEEVIPKEIPLKISLEVDKPHLVIAKADLVRALKYSIIMIKKASNDIAASSLNIKYDNESKKIKFLLKDNMSYVSISADCYNEENVLSDIISFRPSLLLKLLQGADSKVVIYKGTSVDKKGDTVDAYFIRLLNGDFVLDLKTGVTDANLAFPKSDTLNVMFTQSPAVIRRLCNTILPLVSATQDPSSKRAIIYEDRALFKSVTYNLQYRGEFANLCLSKKELELLKLASSETKEDISIFKLGIANENRISIIAGDVEISTSVSIPNRDEVLLSRLAVLETAKYSNIDIKEFLTVLKLSNAGDATTGTLTMNYSMDGAGIDAVIIGRNGDSHLHIGANNYNNIPPIEGGIKVYSLQVLSLLKSFQEGNDLEIAFLSNGLAFRDATLGIEAVMNYTAK